MASIIALSGKYAVGHFAYAIVDDEDFGRLNRYKWKAKPNADGKLIYAIRTKRVGDVTKDIRMHREVLGLALDDPCEPDHKDHDTVNNRRSNLERVTRSENCKRKRIVLKSEECALCHSEYFLFVPAGARKRVYCSEYCSTLAARVYGAADTPQPQTCAQCKTLFQPSRQGVLYCSKACIDMAAHPRVSLVTFKACAQCDKPFVARRSHRLYCSATCERRSEYLRKTRVLS